jgi:ATPase, P-type (transporting), HAD superfamily, subfamily IC/ATPase, P-type (transporting), HAD superfamily, subfamily IC
MTEATEPFAEQGIDPTERVELLLRDLRSSRDGLSTRETQRRLLVHGRNELESRKKRRWPRELSRQFTHPLALLLWGAGGLALVGGNATLAVAIVAVIVINAVLAFFQEVQAERATEALREFLPPHVRVRRDGQLADLEATLLVPGDVVSFGEGDRLSADARLISGAVEVDMSPLTGESQPVARDAGSTAAASSLLEAPDLVFAGTLCTEGEAEGIVFATAMTTQLGRIAALSQRVKVEISPLQQQVNRVAWLIAAIAVASGLVFFLAGISLAGLSLAFAVTAAIGLLVGNVPEGLLPTITLSLAGAVRRMARKRALVKRLTAVETLGSTDVICTDKTGTLTEGRMAVGLLWADGEELVLGGGPAHPDRRGRFAALARAAVRCNNASLEIENGQRRLGGDPSESALLVAALELGEDVAGAQAERTVRRRKAYAFDPRVKRMTTLDEEPDGRLVYHTKGAPLELLERCTSVKRAGSAQPLNDEARSEIEAAFDRYARRGLRVLAFAERPTEPQAQAEDRDRAESGLTFLGLAALEDPLRPEVPEAVARCHDAGIRIIVITGDHGLTAEAIARQAGIVHGEAMILTGAQIEALPQAELDRLLHETDELIVSRSNPETKLHMVDALRAEGHTVAMTGDGVNDAPALRRADIGVAMGIAGTDVAREAATMVLTDDNFASIVAAVEEGRVVYDNVRKFITYIFTHAPAEALPFVVFVAAGGAVPLPILPLQILAIDIGTDTVPALALGREPGEPGIMRRPPRPRQSGIIQRAMLTRAWLRMGMVEAVLALLGFFVVLLEAGWSPGDATGAGHQLHHAYLQATTMTWAGIVAGQVGAAFAARTTRASLREIGLFTNPYLLRGIVFELAFAAAIVYLPLFQGIFHTAALNPGQLALLATFPLIVWGVDESHRYLRRRAERTQVFTPSHA